MTFANWTAYFRANQTHLDDLSWDDTYRFTDRERRAVGRSLQHFQRGESSEGKHLYQRAKDTGNADYVAAIRLFISEEQAHARVLGRFLSKQGLACLRTTWLDGAFRWLRQWGTLEHTIRVLLTAEIIAAVYYRALYHATYSSLLQQLCLRILRDEEMHINFQCFTLGEERRKSSAVGWWWRQRLHAVLMMGTTVLVWLSYNRTLWAAGVGPVGFAASVSAEWERAMEMLRHPETIRVRGQEKAASVSADQVQANRHRSASTLAFGA
ncbi:ferritin-like domain-containing protein [Hymenobacter koreensis]|uniref:Ferritin-like domain-containing protein n=1 Tax=Hymenobacter koreensis TaxID=1084523 RepID=A0ABP8IWN7_9BACT